jgi:uncharacterized protein
LVEKRRGFKGTIALAKMKRLASLLVKPSGEADIEIEFGRDSAGQAFASGTVTAVVWLQCQRCLEPVDINVDSKFRLAVVSSLAESRSLPENYDPLVVEQGPLSFAELVEDEILLALPAIAIHRKDCPVTHSLAEDSQPRAVDSMYNAPHAEKTSAEDHTRQHPFAILADLKEKLKH